MRRKLNITDTFVIIPFVIILLSSISVNLYAEKRGWEATDAIKRIGNISKIESFCNTITGPIWHDVYTRKNGNTNLTQSDVYKACLAETVIDSNEDVHLPSVNQILKALGLVSAKNKSYSLTVSSQPKESRIRIMNIKPRYKPGIRLKEGKYHIIVDSKGYESYDEWVELNTDINLSVVLKKIGIENTDSKKSDTNPVSSVKDWQVIRFPFKNQTMYRLATTSINKNNINLVFDFYPSNECISKPAQMIIELEENYKQSYNEKPHIAYKLPGDKDEHTEITTTELSKNEQFLFVHFNDFKSDDFWQSLKKLHKEKGDSAINEWDKFYIRTTGNVVDNESVIYFSLDGFITTSANARGLCKEALDVTKNR